MTKTERIREYVRVRLEHARASGAASITVSAREISRLLVLRDSFPLICNAMDAGKWRREQKLVLLARRGPLQSSTVVWGSGFLSTTARSSGPDPRALRGHLVRIA